MKTFIDHARPLPGSGSGSGPGWGSGPGRRVTPPPAVPGRAPRASVVRDIVVHSDAVRAR
ncbi:hypothetical protein [Streptomyces sp. NPDC002640]